MQDPSMAGMSVRQAKAIEYSIVAVSVLSLVLLFQPFSLPLYSIGAGLVVLVGLAFNLVPLCTPGRPLTSLIRAALIIVIIFFVVAALSMGAVELYAMYLTVR
jgi:hypothetical protein